MRCRIQFLIVTLWLGLAAAADAQGTFDNLDFESANLPILPPGQSMGVSSSNAFPNWLGYLGTNLQTTVLYNAITIGDASICILGPNYQPGPSLQGSFTAVLVAGRGASSASLRQTGLVPMNTQSLRVLIPTAPDSEPKNFEFSLNGVVVPMVPLAVGPTITMYGGDVSAFAGLTSELRISAYLNSAVPTYFGFRFDAIQFSNQPIPEPSVFGLFALGGLLLGGRLRNKLTR